MSNYFFPCPKGTHSWKSQFVHIQIRKKWLHTTNCLGYYKKNNKRKEMIILPNFINKLKKSPGKLG